MGYTPPAARAQNGGQPAAPMTGSVTPPKLKRGKSIGAPRLLINAFEKWGKTSLAANAPNPVILQSRGETGYETLLNAGLVPECDYCEYQTWGELLAQLDAMIAEDTGHKTIVLDALGGFERLCHEHVCATQFGGDWSETGFASFQKGADISAGVWLTMLSRLDRIRAVRNVTVVVLSHVKVAPFKNPDGPDFDRYVADCDKKTWSATHKWADAILFGTFDTSTVIDKKTKRHKGTRGDKRMLYTQRTAAYDAGNRYNMPAEIEIPATPKEAWDLIWSTIHNPIQTKKEGE